jgi:hypothetical protein
MAISSTDQHAISEPTVSLKETSADEDVADDDGDDAEPAQEAAQPRQAGPKAQGKGKGANTRQGRREAFRGATDQVRNEVLESVRSEMGQFKTQFQQMMDQARQQSAPQGGQQRQQQGPTAFEGRMAEIDRAIQAEMAAFQNHDPRQGKYDLARYNELKRSQDKMVARAEAIGLLQEIGITPEMLQRMQQPQQEQSPGDNPAIRYRWEKTKESYPWIADEKNALAVGNYKAYLVRGLGRPDNIQTDLEAAAHVQNELGLGQRSAPRGNPAPFAGIGGGERGGGNAPREVRMPAAALRGLSKEEMSAVNRAVFSADE